MILAWGHMHSPNAGVLNLMDNISPGERQKGINFI